jgi:hypothetical protein
MICHDPPTAFDWATRVAASTATMARATARLQPVIGDRIRSIKKNAMPTRMASRMIAAVPMIGGRASPA